MDPGFPEFVDLVRNSPRTFRGKLVELTSALAGLAVEYTGYSPLNTLPDPVRNGQEVAKAVYLRLSRPIGVRRGHNQG
jgi:hypothetical protein